MRALVLGPDGPVMDVARQAPRAEGEALLRLRIGGVCATDLELVRGYMGFQGVLGHEFVADVLEHPSSDWVGRRVVGDINCPCRRCDACLCGMGNHCPTRTVLGIVGRDGAFSDHFRLPAANLHWVPDSVTDVQAVFVEPLAAALRILEQVHVQPGAHVVVLGLGRLGQLCARVLALTGADVVGVSRSTVRFETLPPGVRAMTTASAASAPRADIVVDTTGSSAGLALASQMVRPGGTLVLKTTTHDLGDATPTAWVLDEIRVVGSRCGPFAPALRLLASGAVDPTELVNARFPLGDALAGLRAAAAPGTLKVLLDA